jgi:hypothetical protein
MKINREKFQTARGAARGIVATQAAIQDFQTRTQAEVEASIPAGSEKYLKESGNRRYYVFWRPGSREAEISKGWRV